VPLSCPPTLDVLLVIPDLEMPTERARAILPRAVPLEDAVFDLQRLALLLGALARDEPERLDRAMHDRLHQPYRLPLVPGLAEALAALEADPSCHGAALSGSGPTLVGFVRGPAADAGATAVRAFARRGVQAAVRRVAVAARGATWERS
jgi:homoserine kinase